MLTMPIMMSGSAAQTQREATLSYMPHNSYRAMPRLDFESDPIYVGEVWKNNSRLVKLKLYREFTGVLSLFFLALSLVLMRGGRPYEPTFAIFLAVFGIFVVFAMKVFDAR
jgi:hypothetical protein